MWLGVQEPRQRVAAKALVGKFDSKSDLAEFDPSLLMVGENPYLMPTRCPLTSTRAKSHTFPHTKNSDEPQNRDYLHAPKYSRIKMKL